MKIRVIVNGQPTSAVVPTSWHKHYKMVGYDYRAGRRVELYAALPSHPYYSFYQMSELA